MRQIDRLIPEDEKQQKNVGSPLQIDEETQPLEVTDSSTGLTSTSGSASSLDVRRTVGTLQLAVIVFYSVSGASHRGRILPFCHPSCR